MNWFRGEQFYLNTIVYVYEGFEPSIGHWAYMVDNPSLSFCFKSTKEFKKINKQNEPKNIP